MASKNRTKEQLREHYEIEKELADRLRQASRDERRQLYSKVYDDFFRNIKHLPQLTESDSDRQKKINYNLRELEPFLNPDMLYVEVGAGDCKLALEIAKRVKKVIVIEASDELVRNIETPYNFEIVVGDSSEINLADDSVDLVFSNQVMEHLHPEDAAEQLQHIYRILKPAGIYLCMTPNYVTGPHDISKYFDSEPSGFHLREYTIGQLFTLFRSCGFSVIRSYARYRELRLFLPGWLFSLTEHILLKLSYSIRHKLTQNDFMIKFFGINIIGIK